MLRDLGYIVETRFDLETHEFRETMNSFKQRAADNQSSQAVVYIAGHGYTHADQGYIVPVDAPRPSQSVFHAQADLISMREIEDWAAALPVRQALFLFDSCFSGAIFNGRGEQVVPLPLRVPASSPTRQFITAGSEDEVVPARSKFAPVFVDALRERRGDLNRDGYVTGSELGLHLRQELPKYTAQTPQFGRHPDRRFAKGDFLFSLNDISAPSYNSASAAMTVDRKERRESCDLNDVVDMHDAGLSLSDISDTCLRKVENLSCSIYKVIGHLDREKNRYWIYNACAENNYAQEGKLERQQAQYIPPSQPWLSRGNIRPATLRQCVTGPYRWCPMNLNPYLRPGSLCTCSYNWGSVQMSGVVR